MNVRELLEKHEKLVVICHYRHDRNYLGGHAPQNPAVLLQVSLIASKLSGSGNYLRLGDTKGDEIMGWTHVDWLEVLEILGELAGDESTVVPIKEVA